jgi:hypothetical protein
MRDQPGRGGQANHGKTVEERLFGWNRAKGHKMQQTRQMMSDQVIQPSFCHLRRPLRCRLEHVCFIAVTMYVYRHHHYHNGHRPFFSIFPGCSSLAPFAKEVKECSFRPNLKKPSLKKQHSGGHAVAARRPGTTTEMGGGARRQERVPSSLSRTTEHLPMQVLHFSIMRQFTQIIGISKQ